MGNLGKQSQSKVLRHYEDRPEAARKRYRILAAPFGCYGPRPRDERERRAVMIAPRRTLHRLRALYGGSALDRELNAEIAEHLELAIEENIRRGLSPDEARRQALV